MSTTLHGVLNALATPFDDADRVDDRVLGVLVARSVEAGVHGLVAGGGTGEVAALSTDERAHLFEVVVARTAGRVPVVANVGSLTAAEAIRLGTAARDAGADAIMLSAPFYEPLTIAEIDRYFRDVASAVDLPVMLYNNPFTTGVNLEPRVLARLGREVDNIRYVKDSSKDWEQALRLIHHHSDDIGLIVGWDSFLFSALLEGAAGVMAGAANVVPREIVAVTAALEAGDVKGAREHWQHVYPVIDALLALPFPQAVKAGLELRGCPAGPPRPPLRALSQEALAPLRAALDTLDGPPPPARPAPGSAPS